MILAPGNARKCFRSSNTPRKKCHIDIAATHHYADSCSRKRHDPVHHCGRSQATGRLDHDLHPFGKKLHLRAQLIVAHGNDVFYTHFQNRQHQLADVLRLGAYSATRRRNIQRLLSESCGIY